MIGEGTQQLGKSASTHVVALSSICVCVCLCEYVCRYGPRRCEWALVSVRGGRTSVLVFMQFAGKNHIFFILTYCRPIWGKVFLVLTYENIRNQMYEINERSVCVIDLKTRCYMFDRIFETHFTSGYRSVLLCIILVTNVHFPLNNKCVIIYINKLNNIPSSWRWYSSNHRLNYLRSATNQPKKEVINKIYSL